VCTPRWLQDQLTSDSYIFARHHLIVATYDYELIRRALYKRFDGIQGASWSEVAQILARYGQWEFEDYRPYSAD
jgi:hypothetical protein